MGCNLGADVGEVMVSFGVWGDVGTCTVCTRGGVTEVEIAAEGPGRGGDELANSLAMGGVVSAWFLLGTGAVTLSLLFPREAMSAAIKTDLFYIYIYLYIFLYLKKFIYILIFLNI